MKYYFILKIVKYVIQLFHRISTEGSWMYVNDLNVFLQETVYRLKYSCLLVVSSNKRVVKYRDRWKNGRISGIKAEGNIRQDNKNEIDVLCYLVQFLERFIF